MTKLTKKPLLYKSVCDYCGSDKHKLIISAKDYLHRKEGIFSIVKCTNCGLVYTNPRPKSRDLVQFYSSEVGYYQPKINRQQISSIDRKILGNCLDYFSDEKKSHLQRLYLLSAHPWRFRRQKIWGIPKFVREGSLLDIGCSYGGFLYEMKNKGWNVHGIEMNPKMATWGRKNLGLDIFCGDVERFKTRKKFDVITMRMLLEHVDSPKKTLVRVASLLKPNGTLIIIVPDFNGFEARFFGPYAYTLQIPTHLTHFTPKTIKNYLNNLGFHRIKIYHHEFDRDIIMPWEYLARDGKKTKGIKNALSYPPVRRTALKGVLRTLSLFGCTSRMTVYATK